MKQKWTLTDIRKLLFSRPVKIDMFQNHVHELLKDDGLELFKEYSVRTLYIDSLGIPALATKMIEF